MEFVSGTIKLRDIFLDNGNWWKLFLSHRNLIRRSIIINVLKLLVCRTGFLGYHLFVCSHCGKSVKAPHSCKSKFCSPCGKKATDNWIKTQFNTLPKTTWQHITFTLPEQLWDFFWVNRYLMKKVPLIAAKVILKLAKQKGFLPGIFSAIHTFGRDLKRNFHLHLSTTVGGLCLADNSWIDSYYFFHDTIKKMWRYEIISFFRKEFKDGRLKLPPSLKHIKSYYSFCSWTALLYNKTWVVHLNKQTENMKATVEYIGRYLKRPPLGETRIKAYDGNYVTFEYLDHYNNTTETMTLPVLDFIARLISHIHDEYFRSIRYYGFLSNRTRGKLLPVVYKLLDMKNVIKSKVSIPWRQMLINSFGRDPLKCPVCNSIMVIKRIVSPLPACFLLPFHKAIAHGYFPLL